MKLFKYNQFIKESKEDIDSICKKYNIRNYAINRDGSIDVNGDVDLSYMELTKLPIKFGNVTGYFNCSSNGLTSLEGCPQSIGEYFVCEDNYLISLEGAPQSVGEYILCSSNELTSLEGCPQSIGDIFICLSNKIMDFKGFPEYFEGHFDFRGNPVQEILNLLQNHIRSIYWINEHDVIQGNKIIYNRLEEVAYELKMELPENIKFENYEII